MPGLEAPIPPLFPESLLNTCLKRILDHLITCGKAVEELAKKELLTLESPTESNWSGHYHHESSSQDLAAPRRRRTSSILYDFTEYLDTDLSSWKLLRADNFFTRTDAFERSVSGCREYLVAFMASHLLDALTDAARREGNIAQPGHLFSFSVLCNERLQRLVACHDGDDLDASESRPEDSSMDKADIPPDWSNFLRSGLGSDLFLVCLEQMRGLASLTIHRVCTDEMLFIISDTCKRLQVLDISFSAKVSDLGLIYLCGVINSRRPTTAAERRQCIFHKAPVGCKYLRELIFNHQADGPAISAKVVACLLKHLPHLEVVDMEQLHSGIKYYYYGPPADGLTSIQPLKLIHYTGSDNLAEVIEICPKLKTFKLFVTDALPLLGTTLRSMENSLEHITLVYAANHATLTGFREFLSQCGGRISSLEVDCGPRAQISFADLQAISDHCKFLDSLCFNSMRILSNTIPSDVPQQPLNLPFLTQFRLFRTEVPSHVGKEFFCFLLGDCPDLENLYIAFSDTAYFFSDFLLDDILAINPLGRLEKCVLKQVSLTLISALRLISQRPKLRYLGQLMRWDVEPSELTTFAQILRKANSLKLLQDISIV